MQCTHEQSAQQHWSETDVVCAWRGFENNGPAKAVATVGISIDVVLQHTTQLLHSRWRTASLLTCVSKTLNTSAQTTSPQYCTNVGTGLHPQHQMSIGFDQPCPTEMPHWAKNYVTIFVRDAHWMIYLHFYKTKFSLKLLRAFEY